MKNEKAMTLISLVVTIVILIILAGISINVTIGDNGIITKAKQAKANIVLAGEAEALQLNQLYFDLETSGEMTEDEESTKKDEIIALLQKQVEELKKQVISLQTENAELKKQIEDLKAQIANLQQEIANLKKQIANKDIEITNLKDQVSQKEAKIQELQNQLNTLNSLLAQTNATEGKILAGYKAYSGGKLLTGTMPNRGAISTALNCGQTYTIPAGYHNGSGKVTANSLASQTSATATATDIRQGKNAWVNGTKINGTMKTYSIKKGSGYITAGGNVSINLGGKPKFMALVVDSGFKITSIYSETLGYVYEGYDVNRGWLKITDTGFNYNQQSNWENGNYYYIYSLDKDLLFAEP
ncbi:MAG: hypothetical protein ACLU84_05295 [Clostridia bacterium]